MQNPFENAREQVISTPTLIVHEGTLNRNLKRAAGYAREHHLKLRPHTKTHKSRELARQQLEQGAAGLTIAKVGEGDSFIDLCSDLLVAYPVVDQFRAGRLAEFAKRIMVRVAADSDFGINALADAAARAGTTIGILIDVDVGFHRTGAEVPAESLRQAQLVLKHKSSLRLDGIFFYPGHVWSTGDDQKRELQAIDAKLEQHLALWNRSGIACKIVSGGSTPTLYQSHVVTHQTEVRPGTYPYNDMNTARAGHCELDDCAAGIVCTVVSRSVAGKAVIDGGTKTFTSDRNVTQPESGHGYVVEYPAARLARLSEEHGELDVSGCDRLPQLGERVTVIPNHICPCVNLQDRWVLATESGSLKSFRVDSRGQLT